jgi:hypothetical protein
MLRTCVLAALVCLIPAVALADDTSASDKLRILYSTRFTFTDDGVPLITVEIMGGKKEVKLRAKGGLTVRPDGAGGSAIETDTGDAWTITVENAKPAVINEWTVVETLGPDDEPGVNAALARWKQRGFDPRSFEIGTVFGTGGEVIDTREVRIAIDPVAQGKGAAHAAELAKKYGVKTSVHEELVRRPSGTVVAKSGSTVIKNPSVLWFAPKKPSETISVPDVPTNTGGSQLDTGTEERRYWGSVYVTLDHDGSLLAANAVSEDKLLAGLVPAEMYPDSPAAALEAQAIAARTELLQKIGRSTPARARKTRGRPRRSRRRAAWCCSATAAAWSTSATARPAAATAKTTKRSGAAIRIHRCAAIATTRRATCRASPTTTSARSSTRIRRNSGAAASRRQRRSSAGSRRSVRTTSPYVLPPSIRRSAA